MNKQLILWMVYRRVREFRIYCNHTRVVRYLLRYLYTFKRQSLLAQPFPCSRNDLRSCSRPFYFNFSWKYFKEILVACYLISLNFDFSNWKNNQIKLKFFKRCCAKSYYLIGSKVLSECFISIILLLFCKK